MSIITLTTDFGLEDGFIGSMKGVIWGICPEAKIADISHAVSPQNVLEGAYILRRAYSYFPAGTVHVAVVDPGVGTARRPLAARLGQHLFIAPDNGLLTPILEQAEQNGWPVKFFHANNQDYWLPGISHTFHGRDIFAPLGAHLAGGVPLSDLGAAIHDPVRLDLPKPEKTPSGWRAHVTFIDHFGNLATDLPAAALTGANNDETVFLLGKYTVHGLVTSYGYKKTGELVAMINSENYLEIAIVNGSAAQVLGAKVGDIVEVIFES